MRSLQPKVVINDRVGKQFESGDYNTPEQFIPKKVPDRDWETCMTINNSWGYNRLDHAWKSTAKLIQNLAIIASKGGNFLLNVGPMSNGIIPKPEVERLAEIGKWMEVNGEAIHGTTAGPLQNVSWGCTTQKPNKIFLHIFDWPQGELVVEGLNQNPAKAGLLLPTGKQNLQISNAADKLIIKLPPKPAYEADSVIVLE